MRVSLNDNRFVSALENMADTSMFPIEALGVNTIEMTHAPRQIRPGSFDEEMVVVGHQAVGMTMPLVTLDRFSKEIQKKVSVGICNKNIVSPISPGSKMINSPLIFNTQRT